MTTIDDYDLDTINIMLYNNIDRDKPVELTAGMFIFDKPVKGDKIWICTNIRYSEEILMTKTHFECVQLFFDRNLLLNYAKESSIKKPNNIPADVRKISNDVKWLNSEMDSTCKLKHKNECFMKDNMLLVLKYCFPVTFPVDNPPFSFSNGQHNVVTVSRLINGWFNSDKYANFTHMKIDGKSTTVIGCQWLDTIKFHPVYQKVNKNIKQYFVKVKEPLIKLLEQVMDLMEKSVSYTYETVTGTGKEKKVNVSSNFFYNHYELFTAYDFVRYMNDKELNLRNNTMSKYKMAWSENVDKAVNNFKELLQMIITNIQTDINYGIIYKLFVIIYFYYYNISQIKHIRENPSQYIKDITLTDILKLHNKKLKTSLDLILLLCCVFSKEGYNQFVRDMGIDQVTLQKYDFHKPYVQSFESLNLPNRQSTNKNVNALFDIIGYDIQGLYDIYGENGYYDVAKQGDTYIGFDRINLSADKKKAPHYEIYLSMELAGGLVDDNNKSAVSCLFENNRLGRMLQKIIKQEKESEDVLEMREYIDLTDLIKKTEKEVKQKAAQEAQEEKAEKAEKAAKEAKEAQAQNQGPGQQNPGPQNQGSNDNLLEVELDKVPGISADIRKKIMDKINKDIPEVKELAKVISKYNKDVSLKSEYTKILTTTKSKIKSLIENAKYDEEQNKELTPDKKEKARYDLMDYEKIKELIIQMIDQTFFEENKDNAKKFKGGSLKGGSLKGGSLKGGSLKDGLLKGRFLKKTQRRLHRRMHKKTRTL